jgi:hypothetical protein
VNDPGPVSFSCDDAMIDFELTDHDVTVDDRWTYVWSARRRPFVHPLTTPSGLLLTRDAPDDHPWHHGMWFTIKFVNEENFWEEYGDYGVLRHQGEPTVDRGDRSVTVAGAVSWVRPDRETVVIDEKRALTYRVIADDAYLIDFDTTLVPRVEVTLDRTPFTTWGGYGGLTVRGSDRWTDTRLLLADDGAGQHVHGRPARWCDLSNETGGLAILDHPSNPRSPVPWYGSTSADTYGAGWANFFNAAFLWDASMPVEADEPLRLRYRVVVHDRMWDASRLDRVWSEFVL